MFLMSHILYAQWRSWLMDVQQPASAQERVLLNIVDRARGTRFGRDHDFASITSVAEFQARVPVRRYEDFWADYWSRPFPVLENCTWPGTIPYFALTSGTTSGKTKHIPVTHEMLGANSQAVQDLLSCHLVNRPLSQIWQGKGLLIGGSTDLKALAPGIYCGDLSGIEANEVPWWAQPHVFPSRDLALLADWEEKIERIARASLSEDIRAISGAPNWLLMYFDRLMKLCPGHGQGIAGCYPNLELIIHGGVDFKPYRDRFRELLEGSRAELREVYPASEAFIAFADREPDQGLRLIVDSDVFFEFIPVDELDSVKPSRHWVGTLQRDVNYAVVLSTCAGLWSYLLGDTVRFVSLDPPRLEVTGRTTYWLSAFGEHLINVELEEAVAVAARAIDRSIADFCVAPIYPAAPGDKGRHCFVVEFIEGELDVARNAQFASALDDKLQDLNADYMEHRKRDYSLQAPEVRSVAKDALAAWMKSRNMLGGQHKVPRVINDPELFEDLVSFLAANT